MAGTIVGTPANPYSRSTSPSGYAERDQYSQRARDAGYEWDPVQSKWVRSPGAAGGRVSAFTTAAMGGGGGGAGTGGGSLSLSGLGAAGGGGVGGTGGGSTIGGVAPIGDIDTSAADAATFARAKDVAGQTGRASLESLRGLLGETGQLGGGAEVQGTREIVESAAGAVGDVNREQAIQKGERGFQTAFANQASRLTQRGQDIQSQEAQARLALAQTQLQFQQAQMQSQRQLDLLRLALNVMPAGGV